MHICFSDLTIIGSDNGLSPGRRQAIIWAYAVTLIIVTLGTNFNEILFRIWKFSFKTIHFKMLSAKWLTFCLSLNVLMSKLCKIYTFKWLEHLSSVRHLPPLKQKTKLELPLLRNTNDALLVANSFTWKWIYIYIYYVPFDLLLNT